MVGYYIYRRDGASGFIPGYCQTGVPAYTGYRLIAENEGLSNVAFIDDNNGNGLIQGINYCYMVTAFFQDVYRRSRSVGTIDGSQRWSSAHNERR